jgi:hypothetical protein
MSVQDSWTVRTNRTYALKSIWTHPMVLLGDEAQVEARFGSFGVSANFDEEHGLRRTYHSLGNQFRHIRWNS